jgi:hypothetical protein
MAPTSNPLPTNTATPSTDTQAGGASTPSTQEDRLSIQTFSSYRPRKGIEIKDFVAAQMDPWPLLREISSKVVYPQVSTESGQKLAKIIAVTKDVKLPSLSYFGNAETMKAYGDRSWICAICRIEDVDAAVREPSSTLDGSDGSAQLTPEDATLARMHTGKFFAPQDDLFNAIGATSLEVGDWVYVEFEDKVLNTNGLIKGVALKKDLSSYSQLVNGASGMLASLAAAFGGGAAALLGDTTLQAATLPIGQYPLIMRYAIENKLADEYPTNLGDYNLWVFGIRNKSPSANAFNDIIGACWKENGAFKVIFWPGTTKPGIDPGTNVLTMKGSTLIPGKTVRDSHAQGFHKIGKPDQYLAVRQQKGFPAWSFSGLNYFPWDSVKANPTNRPYYSGVPLSGLNIHRASTSGTTLNVGLWSGGCQVFANVNNFNEFLALVEQQNAKSPRKVAVNYTLMDQWWDGPTPDLAAASPGEPAQTTPVVAPVEEQSSGGIIDTASSLASSAYDKASSLASGLASYFTSDDEEEEG